MGLCGWFSIVFCRVIWLGVWCFMFAELRWMLVCCGLDTDCVGVLLFGSAWSWCLCLYDLV